MTETATIYINTFTPYDSRPGVVHRGLAGEAARQKKPIGDLDQ